jgi:hypothetical protein
MSNILLRCPNCLRAVPANSSGVCPRCTISSPEEEWKKVNEEIPVVPEEENGGICPECGGTAEIRPPRRDVWTGSLGAVALSWYFLGWLLLFSGGLRTWKLMLLSVTMISICVGLPLLVFYYHRAGRGLFRSLVVICHDCGYLRVADDEDGREARRFRRARSTIESLFRPLLGAFLFLGVLVVVGFFAPRSSTRVTWLTFAIVALTLYAVHNVRRNLCPPPFRSLVFFWRYR